MSRTARLAVALAGLALAIAASAQPIQLTEGEFTAQTSRLPAVVETFDGFAVGGHSSPLVLANGTYIAASPHVEIGAWCPLSKCLGEGASIAEARSFGAFPAGTTYWGSHLLYASIGQVVRMTVVGKGGTLEVDLPPSPVEFVPTGQFVGVSDPSGIVSVSFREIAGANYSFDNVVTVVGIPASIPTLGAWALAGLALLLAALSLPMLARRRSG